MIRTILLAVSAATAAGLLFVNVYNSVVDAPNWGANILESISAARHYFTASNPGNFFRIFSPINQVLALVVVALSWKTDRYIALSSLAVAVLIDVLTFSYFYPRNEILFMGVMDEQVLRNAWQQWSSMNWLRSAMCLANTVLAFYLLTSVKKNETAYAS